MGRREAFLSDACDVLRKDNIKCTFVAGDVRKEDSAENACRATVDAFGSLDVLVNSAAGNFIAPAEDLSLNGFKTVMDIDVNGVFNMSRSAFPFLKASKGSIINISAVLHFGATYWQTHACAAKAAIDSLTRQLALEWGVFGIRVNGIAPGPIADTPGFLKLTGTEENKKLVESRVPLLRAGKGHEIGDASVFLSSSAATYVSGHTLIVDGGSWLWSPPNASKEQVLAMSRKLETSSRKMAAGSKL